MHREGYLIPRDNALISSLASPFRKGRLSTILGQYISEQEAMAVISSAGKRRNYSCSCISAVTARKTGKIWISKYRGRLE